MIGDDIRGIPEGRLTNHVAGSMEDCSSVGSDSCRCCWIRMLLGTGWFDAAQSASRMPQSLVVYFSGVDLRSGWDLVQSMVVPCEQRAVRWQSTAWRKGSLAGCFDSRGTVLFITSVMVLQSEYTMSPC